MIAGSPVCRSFHQGVHAVKSVASVCNATDKALTLIRSCCVLLSSFAMVVLIAIFAWLVFGRYVLNETPTWVEQLALVLVCYIAFLGAAAGVKDNTHLGVSFIREAMPAPLRRSLRILAEAAMTAFGLVMFLSCLELVAFGWGTLLPMLNIPEGVRTLPAAICGGLIFLFAGGRTIGMVHKYWIGSDTDGTPPAEHPSSNAGAH